MRAAALIVYNWLQVFSSYVNMCEYFMPTVDKEAIMENAALEGLKTIARQKYANNVDKR